MDRKKIRYLLKAYHSLFKRYKELLKQTRDGQFNTVLRSAMSLIEMIDEYYNKYKSVNDRVKKIFLKKWKEKYGKNESNPYSKIKDDVHKILQAIHTRKQYLRQQGIHPQNEG